MSERSGPLRDIRVLDFGHTVMGPSCGMILADLGADVLKVEPAPGGDPTRGLKGFGTGYFGFFNRNKGSVAIDLKTPRGLDIAERLIAGADVLIENFASETMQRLHLDYDRVSKINPRLIYASLKGFQDGPYGKRAALDEVVQMMSGLAFMTGPSGRPLRMGSSVVDIVGGMFAVIGIQAALRERERTGRGQLVTSALFESAVFLMGQHLCYAAQSDKPVPPMPERVSAWAIYELFTVQGGEQIFVAITTDAHWQRFCRESGMAEFAADPTLRTNSQRIDARGLLIPAFGKYFGGLTMAEAEAICERSAIPFAPIRRPEDLFEDIHLKATEGLEPVTLPNGTHTRLPRLPVRMESLAKTAFRDPPQRGEDTRAVLRGLGLDEQAIDSLMADGVVAESPAASSK